MSSAPAAPAALVDSPTFARAALEAGQARFGDATRTAAALMRYRQLVLNLQLDVLG